MAGPESGNHDCIHENDFKTTQQDITDIRTELQNGNKLFNYITDELKIVKDALGVKNKENGDRDKQLNEIEKRANEIGKKAEEKDDTLYEMVTELRVDMAEIKGSLGNKKENKRDKLKIRMAIYGALIGSIASGIIILSIELLKYYTNFL